MNRYAAAGGRYANIVLGVWLFISAFLWHHSPAQFTNAWVLGIICVVLALVALAVPWMRFGNTLLAIWLLISTLSLPREHPATLWSNVAVAIAVFVISLIPGGVDVRAGLPRPRTTRTA